MLAPMVRGALSLLADGHICIGLFLVWAEERVARETRSGSSGGDAERRCCVATQQEVQESPDPIAATRCAPPQLLGP